MASSDWTELTGSITSGSLARGVTYGIARPNGGGSFCYGFNSRDVTVGAAGLFCNLAGFAPMGKGGRVTGAIQRGVSGGVTNFSPLLFMTLQGATTSDNGYLLGLSDEDPHRIVLRKGKLSEGIPAVAPGTQGVLRRSVATYAPGVWLQILLDVIVNPSGDVILSVKQSDLVAHPVSAPVWAAISGMDDFVDDALGINTGSLPYTSGRAGFAFQTKDVTRRGYFDQLEVYKQTLP